MDGPAEPSLTDWAEQALAPYRPAHHHRRLIGQLEQVCAGSIDRLMVLMPPGSAKSTYASVLFPAWWFSRHPGSAVIAANHTANLAAFFGRKLRSLIATHGAALGYGILPTSRGSTEFELANGGSYFATGVRGPITGRRADLVLIDDPIKSHAEADSASYRDALFAWYQSDLATRLKPGGRIVLIMTRWHPDDLGGRLADVDRWTQLRMPAIAEQDDDFRKAGEALWKENENLDDLRRRQAMVGPRAWAALYQQSPRLDTEALFAVSNIAVRGAQPAGLPAVRAWDLAATSAADGGDPDWTVGLLLAREPDQSMVVQDVVRFRGGPHEVASRIVATARQDGAGVHVSLPQDPGQAGKHQVSYFTALLAGFKVTSSPETGSKVLRAEAAAAHAGSGRLSIVQGGWNRAFLDELRDFPNGRKDDQVDALSRAFHALHQPAPIATNVRLSLLAR